MPEPARWTPAQYREAYALLESGEDLGEHRAELESRVQAWPEEQYGYLVPEETSVEEETVTAQAPVDGPQTAAEHREAFNSGRLGQIQARKGLPSSYFPPEGTSEEPGIGMGVVQSIVSPLAHVEGVNKSPPYLHAEPSEERARQHLEQMAKVYGENGLEDEAQIARMMASNIGAMGKDSPDYADYADWVWSNVLKEFEGAKHPVMRAEKMGDDPFSAEGLRGIALKFSPEALAAGSTALDVTTGGFGTEYGARTVGNKAYDERGQTALANLERNGVLPGAVGRTREAQVENPVASILGGAAAFLLPRGVAPGVAPGVARAATGLTERMLARVPAFLRKPAAGAVAGGATEAAMVGGEAAAQLAAGEEDVSVPGATDRVVASTLLGLPFGMVDAATAGALAKFSGWRRNAERGGAPATDLRITERAGGEPSLTSPGGVRLPRQQLPEGFEPLPTERPAATRARAAAEDIQRGLDADLERAYQRVGNLTDRFHRSEDGLRPLPLTSTEEAMHQALERYGPTLFSRRGNEWLRDLARNTYQDALVMPRGAAENFQIARGGRIVSQQEARDMGLQGLMRQGDYLPEGAPRPPVHESDVVVLTPRRYTSRQHADSIGFLDVELAESFAKGGERDVVKQQIWTALRQDRRHPGRGQQWQEIMDASERVLDTVTAERGAFGLRGSAATQRLPSEEQAQRIFDSIWSDVQGTPGGPQGLTREAVLERYPRARALRDYGAALEARQRLAGRQGDAGSLAYQGGRLRGALSRGGVGLDIASRMVQPTRGAVGTTAAVSADVPDFVLEKGPDAVALWEDLISQQQEE